MSLNRNFLEEGEIESDTDDLLKCRKSTSHASEMRDNGGSRVSDGAKKNEDKGRCSRKSKRKRGSSSKERTGLHEEKSSQQLHLAEIAELDEYEMLCIRGASPPHGTPPEESFQPALQNQSSSTYYEFETDYRYDDSDCSRRRASPPCKRRRDRSRKRHRQTRRFSPERKRKRSHSMDDREENKERKMEICKFYLLDCCVKRTICKYMHSEFPCKYYYLGLECQNEKPCKFSHGKALSEEMTQALARHVAAAPKAILGNFRRYCRDEALSMIEAKNRQLHSEDVSTGKESSSNNCQYKKMKSSKSSSRDSATKQFQDISAILSTQQMEKIAALGITNLQQVKQMSLAQLSDIGLSLSQIGEIQKTTQNDQQLFIKPLTFSGRDGGNEVKLAKDDMDMRQLLPALNENNGRIAELTYKCHDNNENNQTEKSRDFVDQESSSAEANQHVVDDEPELVIDESIDEMERIDNEKVDNDLLDNISLTDFDDSLENDGDEKSDEKIDIDNNNDQVSSSGSEGVLLDSLSFDEPFELNNFYSERNIGDPEEGKKLENDVKKASSVLSDFDMRLPFADVIANYVPAMELDASIRSHLGIPYKLIEIDIPIKQESTVTPENISENTLDPRLKKLLQTKSMKAQESNFSFQPDKNHTLSLINPYKIKSKQSETSGDPRKRKEKSLVMNSKHIQQNFNYVLNSFLQKSKWYQNLNSKIKIDVNQRLAELSSELNKFSQNMSEEKQFQIATLPNTHKIQEILFEIGLEVNLDGLIQEIKAPMPAECTESKNHGIRVNETLPKDVPSILNMNLNSNPTPFTSPPFIPNKPLLPNIGVSLPNLVSQRFEYPKPGLLGIAPHLEMHPPPFLHRPNTLLNYNNALNNTIWNECQPRFPGPQNFHNARSIMDGMNRNQFSLQNGKRWNRKMNLKKPRRI